MMKSGIRGGRWVTFWRVVDVLFKLIVMMLIFSRLHAQTLITGGALGPGITTGENGEINIGSILGEPFSGASSAGNITLSSGVGGYLANTGKTTGVAERESGFPASYSLSQNYPNPFNPSTTLEFGLPQAGTVEIKAYDILGREAATILAGDLPAGYHTVRFAPQNLASGVYFYRIVARQKDGGRYIETRKMILLK